jgi:hypothetical protein
MLGQSGTELGHPLVMSKKIGVAYLDGVGNHLKGLHRGRLHGLIF